MSRKNRNTLKLELYKHFNRLVGKIDLDSKAQVKKRIALEDETARLIRDKMFRTWLYVAQMTDQESETTSFNDFFDKTQCK